MKCLNYSALVTIAGGRLWIHLDVDGRFHGGNRGSNPLGDANIISILRESSPSKFGRNLGATFCPSAGVHERPQQCGVTRRNGQRKEIDRGSKWTAARLGSLWVRGLHAPGSVAQSRPRQRWFRLWLRAESPRRVALRTLHPRDRALRAISAPARLPARTPRSAEAAPSPPCGSPGPTR